MASAFSNVRRYPFIRNPKWMDTQARPIVMFPQFETSVMPGTGILL